MKLALGTAQFGQPYGIANQAGQVSLHEGKAMLQLAADNGLDTLDTAIAYGESEQRLGEIGIQGWQVVSKLPIIPDDCSDTLQWVTEAVNGSLRRLNVSSLYGLLLHRPQQLMEKNGDKVYRALQQLKQDGLVQKIGISVYDPSELDTLCKRYQFDLVQAPFNIIDSRLLDTGWLPRLAERGVELHVRSIFLQGLLLMAPSDRPSKFDRWAPLWSKWHEWLGSTGLTPLQACLRYALSFSEISRVITGVENVNQLSEILQAAQGSAPEPSDAIKTDDPDLLNPAHWAGIEVRQ